MRNVYRADLRDMRFVLWEQFGLAATLSQARLDGLDRPLVDEILVNARDFAYRELGTRYQSSDREGCHLRADGSVQLPSGFDAAWAAYREIGWGRIGLPGDANGSGLPYAAIVAIQEMFCGANPGFATLSGFCAPVYYLLRKYGSPALQALFCEKLATMQWSACLCMTEPGAGTDLSSIATRAVRREDGRFNIIGGKVFISAGSHDLAENIVYVVLARAEGAPAGTLGLSCFLVPRFRIGEGAAAAESNHVLCLRLEEKMGLHGCPTAQLSFGDAGECIGYLLGERLNMGLVQLRMMMNQARIATGVYALGLASSAYRNAAEYAAERIQGCDYRQSFNARAPRLPIVAHADVRRMLLEMKCKVEGCRALIYRLACLTTQCQLMDAGLLETSGERERYEGLLNLLTPIAKAYTSDQAWRIAELAIQVHGGYGYVKDYPVEQYARDVKILSIWEGTNHVQAVDLIRDKLALGSNPRLLDLFRDEIERFLADPGTTHDHLADTLGKSLSCLVATVSEVGALVRARKMEVVLLYATRFLGMMATVTLGWLLLEAANIARRALAALPGDHPDVPFYRGKILSAEFHFGQFMPTVFEDANRIREAEDSALRCDRDTFLARMEF